MCGRYTLARSQQELSERFGIKQLFVDFAARYNIAPTQKVPVILNLDGQRVLDAYRWGLIPSWTQVVDKAKPLINARCETLLDKKSFKTAFARRRCLIPADGFYEWKKEGSLKRPMFIHCADHAIFAFAGIWDEWKNEAGLPLRSFSIITTAANEMMSKVHERMPVILPVSEEESWLDHSLTDPSPLLALLRPCPNDLLTMHQVSAQVNSVKSDSAELIEPELGELRLNLSF